MEVRIDPLKTAAWADMRQRFRADLDDDAFSPFDFLFPIQDARILLEGGLDGLVKGEAGRAADRKPIRPIRNRGLAKQPRSYKNPENTKIFLH